MYYIRARDVEEEERRRGAAVALIDRFGDREKKVARNFLHAPTTHTHTHIICIWALIVRFSFLFCFFPSRHEGTQEGRGVNKAIRRNWRTRGYTWCFFGANNFGWFV